MRVRGTGWVVAAVSLAAIVSVTLFPITDLPLAVWTGCLICGERGVADVVVNVLLFLPLGVGLALAGLPVRQAILRSALASATIELAQMLLPGRDPNPGDVLFNTLGAAAGFGLVQVIPGLARLSPRTAARWSVTWAVLIAVVVGATGWLLQPVWPRTTYYGQWTPDLTYLEWYRGTVLSATVGDLAVRSRQIEDTDRARALLESGAPIRVRALAGPAPKRLAPLFSIYDHRRIEILLIGPDRQDLVYRYRARSLTLRLDQPDVRWRNALDAIEPGDSLIVEAAPDPVRRGTMCLTVNGLRRCGLGFGAGRGWSILYYVEAFPAWLLAGLDAMWIGALFLPLGVLARWRPESAVGVAIAGVGLALGPPATNLLPTSAEDYLAAMAGAGVGALGARLLGRWWR